MGKDKKEKKEKTPSKTKEDASDGGDGELRPVCAIAKPLADIGFHKKILKVVKKASKHKQVKRGVKEVVKALRKDVKGYVLTSIRHAGTPNSPAAHRRFLPRL
mmetsp:Transcript_15274/g.50149  ORF Transcript_15274/g.50149 Transcript_15274/m.50149 type:complete len:103 (+) Transcript_15274:133-441(+)